MGAQLVEVQGGALRGKQREGGRERAVEGGVPSPKRAGWAQCRSAREERGFVVSEGFRLLDGGASLAVVIRFKGAERVLEACALALLSSSAA